MNVATEKIFGALFLTVHSLVDDWLMDSEALFPSTLHREIIQKYVAGDFEKMHTTNEETLDIVGMGNMCITEWAICSSHF